MKMLGYIGGVCLISLFVLMKMRVYSYQIYDSKIFDNVQLDVK